MKPHRPAPTHPGIFDLDLHHKYLYYRRTKIVATVGPASLDPRILRALIASGLDVVRVNFSHGKAEDHLRTIKAIRKTAAELKKNVAVLGDLCGPKIRVGDFENGSMTLREKSTVTIVTEAVLGRGNLIPSQYKGIVRDAAVGDPILLDDGNLELRITKKLRDTLEAKVIRGGVLRNHKGMNLPETRMRVSALTGKDRADALFCIKGGVDYIALSFVRTVADVRELREHLTRHGAPLLPIIAKIEKPEALSNIEAIVDFADGIMIARGDLGVEIPAKKVPIIQNKLIRIANQHNKPAIVATQMLESMIDHSRPTRAEVTDVAGACMAGADAVMLSGETAVGRYPLETFETMDSILRETEAYQFFSADGNSGKSTVFRGNLLLDAIGVATAQLSRDLMVRSIFVLTRSGTTARIISSDRPSAPILAFTNSPEVARRMQLFWGVCPHVTGKKASPHDCLAEGEALILEKKLAKQGDYVIMISGLRTGTESGGTNSIMMHRVR
jgi:pyruvate kinase